MENRNYLFDNLKGFLILCVILGNSLEYANPTSINTHYLILVLYIFHMPLFAFVSGYFSSKSRRTTQDKVVGILKIYLCAQAFYYIINKFYFSETKLNLEIFSPSWTLWYFVSLMFWYIISDFIKEKKKWFMFSILIALYIGFDSSVGSYVSIARTFFFLPYFIAGMSFNTKYLEKLRKYKLPLALLTVVVLGVLYLISPFIPVELLFEYSKYITYFDNATFPLLIRLFHYISSFIVGGFLLSIVPEKKTKLSKIGEFSVVMYVTHAFIIKVLYKYPFITYESLVSTFISEIIIISITILVTLIYVKLKSIYKMRQELKSSEVNII